MSFLGGILIGLAASILVLFAGRVAGISGILGGLFDTGHGDRAWRIAFLTGLIGTGAAVFFWAPQAFGAAPHQSWLLTAIAGLLVGFGTRMGNGCTSGHGVCGVGRLSLRSVIATVVFI